MAALTPIATRLLAGLCSRSLASSGQRIDICCAEYLGIGKEAGPTLDEPDHLAATKRRTPGTSPAGMDVLSVLSDAAVVQLYRRRSPERGNELDAGSLAQLLSELGQVRARNYAINIGRAEPELAAICAPVGVLANGRSFALSLSTPISRAQDLQGSKVISLPQAACGHVRDAVDALGGDVAR